MRTFLFFIMLVLFVGATSTFAQDGVRRMKPRPYEYGRVVIDNFSSQANMAPVAFDHWLHRAKFTCRLCHVDIGFAMTAGATKITAADNMRGYFCGTCHNDRRRFGKGTVFASCAAKPDAEDLQRCALCHGTDRRPAREKTFGELAATLPRERLGNSIDWEGAEKKGLIHPVQYLDGESVSNSNLASQKDFSLATKMEGMPEIVFSTRSIRYGTAANSAIRKFSWASKKAPPNIRWLSCLMANTAACAMTRSPFPRPIAGDVIPGKSRRPPFSTLFSAGKAIRTPTGN